MTIDLHLIGLAIVVALDHLSCMVYIFRVLVPYAFYENLRCILLLGHYFDIFFEFVIKLQIPAILNIILIVDNYPETLRISGLIYH